MLGIYTDPAGTHLGAAPQIRELAWKIVTVMRKKTTVLTVEM